MDKVRGYRVNLAHLAFGFDGPGGKLATFMLEHTKRFARKKVVTGMRYEHFAFMRSPFDANLSRLRTLRRVH